MNPVKQLFPATVLALSTISPASADLLDISALSTTYAQVAWYLDDSPRADTGDGPKTGGSSTASWDNTSDPAAYDKVIISASQHPQGVMNASASADLSSGAEGRSNVLANTSITVPISNSSSEGRYFSIDYHLYSMFLRLASFGGASYDANPFTDAGSASIGARILYHITSQSGVDQWRSATAWGGYAGLTQNNKFDLSLNNLSATATPTDCAPGSGCYGVHFAIDSVYDSINLGFLNPSEQVELKVEMVAQVLAFSTETRGVASIGDPISLDTGGNPIGGVGFTINSSPSPVPLPGAVWLFGSGLLGLAGWSRHRRNNLPG